MIMATAEMPWNPETRNPILYDPLIRGRKNHGSRKLRIDFEKKMLDPFVPESKSQVKETKQLLRSDFGSCTERRESTRPNPRSVGATKKPQSFGEYTDHSSESAAPFPLPLHVS